MIQTVSQVCIERRVLKLSLSRQSAFLITCLKTALAIISGQTDNYLDLGSGWNSMPSKLRGWQNLCALIKVFSYYVVTATWLLRSLRARVVQIVIGLVYFNIFQHRFLSSEWNFARFFSWYYFFSDENLYQHIFLTICMVWQEVFCAHGSLFLSEKTLRYSCFSFAHIFRDSKTSLFDHIFKKVMTRIFLQWVFRISLNNAFCPQTLYFVLVV